MRASHCGLVHQSHGLSSLESALETWTLFAAERTGFLRQPRSTMVNKLKK